eukprot:gnl/TRDRNA2_/TRDRNA2_176441_c12_seq21.p1 gnl/TRDRNA2_/TRDRNA2_176441_c12~~gnl/TRDRNA2_/TRDRNA2_176441_c12_seq21.p1  ORF type:complete len:691 (+),score=253.38 gnl/TRDRNA2_/TRDRNA2_176441_c12_seq21:54-2126(+)
MRACVLIVASLALLTVPTNANADYEVSHANPIRKVVTLLQKMEGTVQAEGEKEKELFDKYMCYCKTGSETLGKSIADANTKIPQVQSSIESGEETKATLESEVKTHKTDREAAKSAMGEATGLREKEAAAFASDKAESQANLAALAKATTAIEKGMSGSFLQSAAAGTLRKMMESETLNIGDYDRQTITVFLSEQQSESEDDSYSPSSGQITGILKQMKDTMEADLADKTKAEESAIKNYEELMGAKTKEVAAATSAIEKKTVRIGELGVQIVDMKEDLADTQEALAEDTKFLQDLEKNCKTVGADYAERQKTRGEELLAIADTIKVLNDDDALELFKKALPGSSALLQVSVLEKGETEWKNRALALVLEARKHKKSSGLDFISLALRGKQPNFGGITKMIDEMIETLHAEQADDDHKKEYCLTQFDVTEDKKKVLARDISDLESAIDEMKSAIATTADEIKALEDGIKALDKSVAEATEQRKEESEDFQSLMASDSAAQELLEFAKNRLNKFYNPKLYKPPPAPAFIQLHQHKAAKSSLGAPPQTFLAVGKKSEEAGGVIAMIDMMIADLEKEMTIAKTEEKNAQEEYEEMMSDSAEKRAEDTKALTQKASAKASYETKLQASTDKLASTEKELMATGQYIASIHGECDWILQFFDMRKEARTKEIDALGKAKAVLSGASYSLLQVKAK